MIDTAVALTHSAQMTACIYGALDQYAALVIRILGYASTECMIETCDPPTPFEGSATRIDRFKVCGEVCFVVKTVKTVRDGAFSYTVSSRVVKVPPARHPIQVIRGDTLQPDMVMMRSGDRVTTWALHDPDGALARWADDGGRA